MSEIQYELKNPFEYARKGEQVEANFVTIVAPGFKQIEAMTPIKQGLMAAIFEMQSRNERNAEDSGDESPTSIHDKNEDSVTITGETAMQLLYAWSGDLSKLMGSAQKLLKSGVATLDGETPLTNALLDKMSHKDFEGLVGDYLANFIVPSLTDGL